MHSIAFHVGPLTIYWYGIMAALGFISAVSLLMLNRKHAGLDSEQVTDIAMFSMISAIVGARIFYVVQFRDVYRDNPLNIIRIDQGGLVFFGGFICATSTLLFYCWRKKLNLLTVLDIFGPALAIGHFFGRIGCFMNGCCYGKPSNLPWAVNFPQGSAPAEAFPGQSIHPVQIYESIFNLMLAGILLLLLKRTRPGQTAAAYLICYGIGRFTIESLRGDHHQFILGKFTVSQSIGFFIALAGIAFLIYTIRKSPAAQEQKNG